MVKETYDLPTETLASLPMTDVLNDITDIQKYLNQQGIPTQNTRIERYIRYLNCLINEENIEEDEIFKNSSHGPFEHSNDWFVYVLREVHELSWILKGLKEHQPKGLNEKLEFIVGGSDFATLDKNSLSRDIQFELRIASYFCLSGFEVDLSTETDLIVQNNKSVYFIECKRVTTTNALEKRLKKAKRQLKSRMPKKLNRKSCYGVIAVDVTKVAYPHNGLTWGLTNEHSKDLTQDKLKEIGDDIGIDDFLFDSKRILEVWLNIHIPSLIFTPPTNTTRLSFYVLLNQFIGRKAYKAYKALIEAKIEATKADTREMPSHKLTRRKSISIPNGTKFSFDDELLEKYLCTDQVDKDNQFFTICTAQVGDEEYCFSSIEFAAAIGSLSQEEKFKLWQNIEDYRCEILGSLFMVRFPFEESEF